jgi:hypothetical protein
MRRRMKRTRTRKKRVEFATDLPREGTHRPRIRTSSKREQEKKY